MIKFPKKPGARGLPDIPPKASVPARPPDTKPLTPIPARVNASSKDGFQPSGAPPRTGFAASQARLAVLTTKKSELELQSQHILQSRHQLTHLIGVLSNLAAKHPPGSREGRTLESRIANIQQVDKAFELQLQQLSTQRQSVDAELDAVQKLIAKTP
ncbi:hypothetical protein LXT21_39435 [Myxococcus sp. K38C18041901]|uniref:hypothetical protein n=1 Tax=Myxococcus guangdongensis TaxID=2906760 RepID=UPI0020A7BB9A|nr:hypothetical protein [Myxococcus guangdongensis]MCP3064863.1 hypothetical protein [Myxococcus guangdongensis]